VIEESLGRYLGSGEYVHHKNGIKTDNRLENLAIVTEYRHHGKVLCPFCEGEFLIQ
jgi:hypothetical protein